ncbi:MAG: Gfo/Idh/MocA family protein [Vicinamibacteria bacterium]
MLRVALVGAGGMGREHGRAFAAIPGIVVAGVHSRTRARAEGLAAELQVDLVVDDLGELQARTGADLVVVAVPELEANRVAKLCFRQDWAVLLEKPAGYDLADAEDIAAAAQGRAKPVMVGLNRRFYASTLAAKTDLDGRAGRRYIQLQDQQSYAEARHHGHPPQVVERFMYANSIHIIDYAMNFGRGEISQVTPLLPWRGEDTDVCVVKIDFDSGDVALYEGLWRGPGPWACAVSTPGRRWVLQPLEQARFQNAGERRTNEVSADAADVQYKAGFLRQAEAVVARVRGEPSTAVSLDESLRTMRLIQRMFGV